ncbi:MAG: hypothetical protein FIB08_14635 [Candidatus Methanoperedens sp.]|nr:hypothetical protein [Candidatus Methanoperedens sp.]
MHSTTQTGFIWTRSEQTDHGYGWSSPGNLERIGFGKTLIDIPPQERFDSNGKRTFPVAVYGYTARLAGIKSIVAPIMSRVHRTAVRTPFTERYSINFRSGFPVNLLFPAALIDFLSGSKVKVFNRNGSFVLLSKFYDFFSYLPASCLDKIRLVMFQLPEMFPGLIFVRTFFSKMLKAIVISPKI